MILHSARLKFLTLILGLGFASTFIAARACAAQGPISTLDEVQWQYRVFVYGCESGCDKQAPKIVQQASVTDQMLDQTDSRRLLIIHDRGKASSGIFIDENGACNKIDIDLTATPNLRPTRRDGFQAILIGLDGGIKKRWSRPVRAEVLFSVIDAMPMRQNEIRRRRKRKGKPCP